MKGKIEVFAIASDGSETLILSEPNLIVNGAGQSIVDMFTCPSSVLSAAPAVMDASNWRWGALSFGPAASSFQENAYFFPPSSAPYRHVYNYPTTNKYPEKNDLCNGVSADVTSYIDQISTDRILRPLWVSSFAGANTGVTASSYSPPYQLPSYPDPMDTKLEDVSTAYAIVSGDGTQCFGQFENRINFASGDPSSYFQGAYPPSGTTTAVLGELQLSAMLVSSYEGDFSINPLTHNVLVSAPQVNYVGAVFTPVEVGSNYNNNAAMDYRGFILANYAVVGSLPRGTVGVSGVINSPDASALVVDPRVVVETKIYASDLWSMNLYGGLHHIGLWSLDCKKSLETSTVPLFPVGKNYIDSNGVTPREFRLFAKKTFTENLCQVEDHTTYSGFVYSAGSSPVDPIDLKITWTIDFRSKHD